MRRFAKFAAFGLVGLAPAVAAAAGTVYAHDLRFAAQANLFSFEANTPLVQTQIGPVGGLNYSTFAMDFDASNTRLYAIDHILDGTTWTMPRLGRIDTSTGVFTPTVNVTGAGFNATSPVTGLSIDRTTGVFYASKATQLFSIDAGTGIATLIGNFTNSATGGALGTIIDISVDNFGTMYAHELGTLAAGGGALYRIDKNTGSATFIGRSGVQTSFAQGMDFDPTTNILYAALYTSGGAGSYGTWDTTTGAWTQILPLASFPDPTPNGRELEIAIAPAPGALALLGFGGLAMSRRRR